MYLRECQCDKTTKHANKVLNQFTVGNGNDIIQKTFIRNTTNQTFYFTIHLLFKIFFLFFFTITKS